ncbi:hypothetical protein PHMEG_00030229 [Phytophthora megakarya]|uniref:Uncharacterized protein n=1 Tax=Phytophthora megakarya TaxID=4795 RepID=A0A225V136_9STRA|nr:hypothetical protein PHMEG_00030229 [Phytophthora megakarya]
MLVGGHCVLFTNWAFKRQLQRRKRLAPIADKGEYERDEGAGMYSGKIVEL